MGRATRNKTSQQFIAIIRLKTPELVELRINQNEINGSDGCATRIFERTNVSIIHSGSIPQTTLEEGDTSAVSLSEGRTGRNVSGTPSLLLDLGVLLFSYYSQVKQKNRIML
ncbi:uncharacterized protein LOC134178144 [Corticium candelabrum]|uniref:uncharacterized protein LOC134178144 n=1 Tax=Corticium candelabrum TaxID=121492 RepID=UPI002E27741A|nr:uncharacterized protein LOC134178144 [Corticium candelabrum]